MTRHIAFDFETYSACNLKKTGAWVYAQDPSTKVVCMAYSIDGAAPRVWVPGEGPMPDWLRDIEGSDITLRAWNAPFEFGIIHYCLKLPTGPIERWHDTMAEARAVGLPGALAACGDAMKLPGDLQKDARGKLLISRLSKPNSKGVPYDKPDREELLQEFYAYCAQDVIAESEIARRLPRLTPDERRVWELDQAINFAGIPIDVENAEHAVAMYTRLKDEMDDDLRQMTGLDNPNSTKQFKDWLNDVGVKVDNVRNETLQRLLDKAAREDAKKEWYEPPYLPDEVVLSLGLKQDRSRSPVSKYEGMIARSNDDQRLRGTHLYSQASTGRWASVGINTQNMSRPARCYGDLEDGANTMIPHFASRDAAAIASQHGGSAIDVLASCIRGMICASPGHRLIVCDFSAIEARVTAWFAGQQSMLDVFNGDGRVYEAQASDMFNVAIDDVDGFQRLLAKVAILALGFGGGKGAFVSMASVYGLEAIPEAEAQGYVTRYRQANPEIVQFWSDVMDCVLRALRNKGTVFSCADGKVKAYATSKAPHYLQIRLPSGRCLHYWYPSIVEGKFGSMNMEFSGIDSYTRAWSRQQAWYGTLVENIVQACARDLLAHAMLRLRDKGYQLIMHVHDEAVAEMPDGYGSLEEMNAIMCEVPDWAAGLPLDGAGYESKRYQK